RDLIYCQAAVAKCKQFGRERTELANLWHSRRSSTNCEFHRLIGYVIQRTTLAEPANNLLIISRNFDDAQSGRQSGMAVRRNQLFDVIADLLLIRFMIAAKQRGFVFRQSGNGYGRPAHGGDVVLRHKAEKVRGEAALRVIGGAIAVRKT